MPLTSDDVKVYADGVRYQIDRCKAICDAPSTSNADFERANSILSLLPRVEETALVLAYYMGEIENRRAAKTRKTR